LKVKEIIKDSSVWMPGRSYNNAAPKVSVLLPTFQRAASGLFENAVSSVLNQTFADLELIIVDDCSVDGTFDRIKHFMELDGRVSCIRHRYSVGLPAISEYEAYLRARGTYIAFLFDNNEWDIHTLEQTYSLMEENNIQASYGMFDGFLSDCTSDHRMGTSGIQDVILSNPIANGTVVLHRDVLEHIGLFDPHLSMIQNCNWDLWIRIARKYDFVQTNVSFGKTYVPTESPSFDNSGLIDAWFSAEHMAQMRNELLNPANFAEYSIDESFGARSNHYVFCQKNYDQYMSSKEWYHPRELPPINPIHRHVLVLINEPSASIVSFDRVRSQNITVRFASHINLYEADLALADAVIISRDNVFAQKHLDLIQSLSIPVYYYTDDNFHALAEQTPNDVLFRAFAKANSREKLEPYNGVILSSKSLLQYYQSKNLHQHLLLLEPAIDATMVLDHPKEQKPYFSVAFLGGNFRADTLQQCVLPALKRLSEEIPVRLYCPDDFDLRAYASPRFQYVTVPRTKCLDLILTKFRAFEPDVQVHCGKALPNNRFKTENALINATIIGAVLLASAVEPYQSSDHQDCFVMSLNTVDAWYQKLKKLAKDSALRNQIYQNAKAYCLDRYDANHVWSELEQELVSYPELSDYDVYKRLEKTIFQLRFQQEYVPPIPKQTNWETFKLFWQTYGVLTLFIAAWKVVKKSTLWVISKLKLLKRN